MRGNMRAERARTGKSAAEVAELIGVSTNTLYSWEHGEKEPVSSNLMKLADFYGCSPEYLLGLTEDRTRQAIPTIDKERS